MIKRILIITIALLLILLPAIFMNLRINTMRGDQEKSFDRLFNAMEESVENENLLKDGMRKLGEENNTLRRALNLPEKELNLLTPPTSGLKDNDSATERENPDLPFYNALDHLADHQKDLEAAKNLDTFLNKEALKTFLRDASITAARTNKRSAEFLFQERSLGILALTDASPSDSSGSGYSMNFQTPNVEEATIDSAEALISVLKEKRGEAEGELEAIEIAKERIRELHGSSSVRQAARERGVLLTPLQDDVKGNSFSITTKDDIKLFTISAQRGKLFLSNRELSPETAEEVLRREITNADARGSIEKAMDDSQERILALAEDEAFRALLEKRGLLLSRESREDNDYIYFDLENSSGEREGAFAVLKGSGEIYLSDKEDIILGSLKRFSFSGSSEKEREPLELPSDQVLASLGSIGGGGKTILLVGSHENNADTIMLAHLDGEKSGIIAIPRDLWWKQRKLNAYFRIYGPEQFMEELGALTGLSIDDYLVVDMYAFIDVINILGGIDITLDEALIDPTYKIRENGVWKTLHYSPGTHHLDGIGALRIARSRHTSDDFNRAERQQLIISALKDRVDTMGVTDITAVYRLFQSLSRYVSSSFSPFEMAKLYLDNRSMELETLGGITTDNVLVATYSNLLASGKSADELDEDFYKGAWILVPKENNWKLIPWYIRQLLGDEL